MNKITRKRPNEMYKRTYLYNSIGVYPQISLKEHYRSYRKFKYRFIFRTGKSGRKSTTHKVIQQLIEVNRYERQIDSN